MKNTLKNLVRKINNEENFEQAKGMLEMLNTIYGTKYGFLGKRVVRFDNPDASTCERYKHCRDLEIELAYKAKYN